jgi:putative ABC transport system ATP-binding protein
VDIHLAKIKVRLPGQDNFLFQIKNLRIHQGSRLLIQGPSGKGKTTLLHLIAGLFLPSEGQVSIGDYRLTSMTDEERSALRRSEMGVVFQTLNLIDHLSAFENVLLGLHGEQDAKDKAQKALERVGLGSRSKSPSALMSLGERQRVAVARVLAAEPRVVLADEPTSSLDKANAEKILEYFMDLPTSSTLIMVSHDERIRHHFSSALAFSEVTSL